MRSPDYKLGYGNGYNAGRKARTDADWTDDMLRAWWKSNGGSFHGPHVETGTMPEEKLLPLLRDLLAVVPVVEVKRK